MPSATTKFKSILGAEDISYATIICIGIGKEPYEGPREWVRLRKVPLSSVRLHPILKEALRATIPSPASASTSTARPSVATASAENLSKEAIDGDRDRDRARGEGVSASDLAGRSNVVLAGIGVAKALSGDEIAFSDEPTMHELYLVARHGVDLYPSLGQCPAIPDVFHHLVTEVVCDPIQDVARGDTQDSGSGELRPFTPLTSDEVPNLMVFLSDSAAEAAVNVSVLETTPLVPQPWETYGDRVYKHSQNKRIASDSYYGRLYKPDPVCSFRLSCSRAQTTYGSVVREGATFSEQNRDEFVRDGYTLTGLGRGMYSKNRKASSFVQVAHVVNPLEYVRTQFLYGAEKTVAVVEGNDLVFYALYPEEITGVTANVAGVAGTTSNTGLRLVLHANKERRYIDNEVVIDAMLRSYAYAVLNLAYPSQTVATAKADANRPTRLPMPAARSLSFQISVLPSVAKTLFLVAFVDTCVEYRDKRGMTIDLSAYENFLREYAERKRRAATRSGDDDDPFLWRMNADDEPFVLACEVVDHKDWRFVAKDVLGPRSNRILSSNSAQWLDNTRTFLLWPFHKAAMGTDSAKLLDDLERVSRIFRLFRAIDKDSDCRLIISGPVTQKDIENRRMEIERLYKHFLPDAFQPFEAYRSVVELAYGPIIEV